MTTAAISNEGGANSTPHERTPAIVSISRYGAPEENASILVWLLGRMALHAPYEATSNPKVGDIVIEITHLMGLAKHSLGLLSAVGTLLRIDDGGSQGEIYTIRTVEGIEQRWRNAMVYVLERAPEIKELP